MSDSLNVQGELAESALRFIRDRYPNEAAWRRQRRNEPFNAANWKIMAELGWLAIGVAPEYGGMGGGLSEIMAVTAVLGRAPTAEPLITSSVVCGSIISQAATQLAVRTLGAMTDGSVRLALAHSERWSRWRRSYVTTRCEKTADGSWRLKGAKHCVPDGPAANTFIMSARVSGSDDDVSGVALFLLDRATPGLVFRDYQTVDGRWACDIAIDNLVLSSSQLLSIGAKSITMLSAAEGRGIAAIAAEATGAMDALIDMTREYLHTRKQFGNSLVVNQVLRHRMAEMVIALDEAHTAAYMSMLAAESGDEHTLSVAKKCLGKVTRQVGHAAIQLHGAIGMTDDCQVGSLVKRLEVINMSFGNSAYHLSLLAKEVAHGW